MFEHILLPEPKGEALTILVNAYKAAISAPKPNLAERAFLTTLGESFGAKRAYIYELPEGSFEFVCAVEWCAPHIDPMSDVTHGLSMDMASRWFGDGNDESLIAVKSVESIAKVNPEYAALFGPRAMNSQVLGKLIRGGRPLGVLGFDDPDPKRYDMLCELMYPICAFAAAMLNTRILLARMGSAGVVDKLTGAGTRMGFMEKVGRIPKDVSIGIAYFDIVGLQGVNDVRGHKSGDALLMHVREALITEFQDDQVFRLGGDEFVALVYDLDERTFDDAVSRVCMRLDQLDVYVAHGTRWQDHLESDYEAILRQAMLACSKDKLAWEREGGQRIHAQGADAWVLERNDHEDVSDNGTHLDIPCYRNNEFFRRAHIWAEHVETSRIGMAALDINYFKLYNDLFGREAGDLLLETIGGIISELANVCHGVAGYLGGDNFGLLFPVEDDLNIKEFCNDIELQILKYANTDGFSPSVGVVITRDPSISITILYDRALVALSNVKGNYTNHVSFYNEDSYERDRQNQILIIKAREGLEKGEFTFFLQPKVDIETNKVVSAEALARWIHEGRVVPPIEFVELLENTGYIFALDAYIWEAVCAWQRSVIDRGIEPISVSVNVSRVDFYFTDLANHFINLVEKYQISPQLIGIEVTESAYSKDIETINEVIHRLQEYGFQVLMDDFGSGYSSLKMLRSVSVNVLKMDKGFIDHANIQKGSDTDAIIGSVIKMAHMMGLSVVSEGVETEEQRDSLRCMGCDYVQGYFYYRPMAIDDFERILTNEDAIEKSDSEDRISHLS